MIKMQDMKEVRFDIDYLTDEYELNYAFHIPEMVKVHMHIVFKSDIAELMISVDDINYDDYVVGVPYYQSVKDKLYTHQEIIEFMVNFIKNNFVVEGYLEDALSGKFQEQGGDIYV